MALQLKRKIDDYLVKWKNTPDRLPLIVKGARQIGKTFSIENFAKNYKNFVEINFITSPEYKSIFESGFSAENVIKQISMINPKFEFAENDTLIFFDEIQACPNCATSLKFFALDKKYDVICSGSLMGISYQEIDSVSVGYKTDYEMYSLDFEEFLWAKGYRESQIDSLFENMKHLQPLSQTEMDVMSLNFKDYMLVGGMPQIVRMFVSQNNFSGILDAQRALLRAYGEDIVKYAAGLDKAKVRNVYENIPAFLAKENKKFQISKIARGARNREYIGVVDWLNDAGIVNICYCLDLPELPFKGNYNPQNYKLYFRDTGLLIAALDDEAQTDLRANKNFNTYKGAIYENIVADMLTKAGYPLYYFKNEKGSVEMDFFVRDANSVIPVEVKANDNSTPSLNTLINSDKYPSVKYGIKLCNKNIGFNGKFFTFPYFLTFLLKKYILWRIFFNFAP
jgi:hypothetical protein